MSSLSFAGDSTSYISIASSDNTRMGTGDFTIEWFQYQTDARTHPRIFQIGTYPTASIGVSIELGTFYFWSNAGIKALKAVGLVKNTWTHFAIVRSAGITTIYKNGAVFISGFSDTTNYNSTMALLLGNETTRTNESAFGGYMAYFHIIKGSAKYSAPFPVPTAFPTTTLNTVFLIKADESIGSGITVNNVGTVPLLPPGFDTPDPAPEPEPEPEQAPEPTLIQRTFKKPLFSNNLVFYKSGSGSSITGSFGVTNYRAKARKR